MKIKIILLSSVLTTLFLTGCGDTPSDLISEEIKNKNISNKSEAINLIDSIYKETKSKKLDKSCSVKEAKDNFNKTVNMLSVELCEEASSIDTKFKEIIKNNEDLSKLKLTFEDIQMKDWNDNKFEESETLIYMKNNITLNQAIEMSKANIEKIFVLDFIKNGILDLKDMNYIIDFGILQKIEDIKMIADLGVKNTKLLNKWKKLNLPIEHIYAWMEEGYTYEKAKEWFDLQIQSPKTKGYKLLKKANIDTPTKYKEWVKAVGGDRAYRYFDSIIEWNENNVSLEEVKKWSNFKLSAFSQAIKGLREIGITKSSEFKPWFDMGIKYPSYIKEFKDSKMSMEEIKEWTDIKVTSLIDIKNYKKFKISSKEVKEWLDINIKSARIISLWKESKFNTAKLVSGLKKEGYDIVRTSPSQILKWKEKGILDDTKEWISAGVTNSGYMSMWRNTGITPKYVKDNNFSKLRPNTVSQLKKLKLSPDDIRNVIKYFGNSIHKFTEFSKLDTSLSTNDIIELKKTGIKASIYKIYKENGVTKPKDIRPLLKVTKNSEGKSITLLELFKKDITKYNKYIKRFQGNKFKRFYRMIAQLKKSNKKIDLSEVEKELKK